MYLFTTYEARNAKRSNVDLQGAVILPDFATDMTLLLLGVGFLRVPCLDLMQLVYVESWNEQSHKLRLCLQRSLQQLGLKLLPYNKVCTSTAPKSNISRRSSYCNLKTGQYQYNDGITPAFKADMA